MILFTPPLGLELFPSPEEQFKTHTNISLYSLLSRGFLAREREEGRERTQTAVSSWVERWFREIRSQVELIWG